MIDFFTRADVANSLSLTFVGVDDDLEYMVPEIQISQCTGRVRVRAQQGETEFLMQYIPTDESSYSLVPNSEAFLGNPHVKEDVK